MRTGTSGASVRSVPSTFESAPTTTTRCRTTLSCGARTAGHVEDHSEFLTEQQRHRLERAAMDYAEQFIGQMLDDSFGKMARSTRNNDFIQVKYRSKPFFPAALPGIDEERLIRERMCGTCGLHYAVYGEHRFCPVCGSLPASTVALDALSADRARLTVLHELPNDTLRVLRETGVLDRTYADTVENVVGTVETFAERTFHMLVPDAEEVVRGRGKVFQRLNDFADLFLEHADGPTSLRAESHAGSSSARKSLLS